MQTVNVETIAKSIEICGMYSGNTNVYLTVEGIDPEPILDELGIREVVRYFGDDTVLDHFTIQDVIDHFGTENLLTKMDPDVILRYL
ncbi:hypothetical protein HPMBJEAJ_00403 [Aeromonas phage avDM6]|nr:hypothetical protein HPMBJEAJ_00403 [Aeromonas phage avDM6]